MQPGTNHRARSAPRAQHKQTLTKNDNQIIGRLPPFGKDQAARLQYGNRPFAAVVCIGQNDWQNAKKWHRQADMAPMVLPAGEQPERYKWPVLGCLCLVDWDTGPTGDFVVRLVKCLLRAGALSVTVRPLFVDHAAPAWLLIDGRWQQVREIIKTYYPPRKEARLVA